MIRTYSRLLLRLFLDLMDNPWGIAAFALFFIWFSLEVSK